MSDRDYHSSTQGHSTQGRPRRSAYAQMRFGDAQPGQETQDAQAYSRSQGGRAYASQHGHTASGRGISGRTASSRGAGARTANGRGAAGRTANGQVVVRRAPKKSRLPLVGLALGVLLIAGVGAFGITQLTGGGTPSSSSGPLTVSDTTQTNQAASSSANTNGTSSTDNADKGQIILTLGGSADTYVAKGEEYIESGCHAFDKTDGNITSQVKTEGSVDASTVGDYKVTYSVTDSQGATASKERTVHVIDNMDKNKDGIPVLMYHYVYTKDDPPKKKDANYLLDTKLEAQLKWLTKNKHYYPSYQELAAYIDGKHSLPRKSVILTFDDGQEGFLKYGIPLLEKYQVPATSFIICNQKKAAQKISDYASEYVSFQSHSYACHQDGHTNIGRGGAIYDKSESQLIKEEKKATELLGTNEAFAYPYGDVSDVAPSALKKAGYLCAFTIHNGRVKKGDDPMQLTRVRMLGESALEGFKAQVLGEDYK
ncbi:MAG: DUF5011 domain-containing protein [Coriobacteriia bacterium]|nr:DUF5011 domain-containing protein [Coriobacteriia bacterium]